MNKYFKKLPVWVQNSLITLYNSYQYNIRHGGEYKELRKKYKKFEKMSENEWKKQQNDMLKNFLAYATKHSTWYSPYKDKPLSCFPILNKEELINRLDEIKTLPDTKGIVSHTGGTTGASMKVVYQKADIQERYAILDNFRSMHGYSLGKKTAWFSGKELVDEAELDKGICSRDDWINKIRFFSTFHINDKYFDIYWKRFCEFEPEFIVGFPSSVYLICKMAKERGVAYTGKVKVFFPTAETVLPEHRQVIGDVLGCVLRDQYASSEGAPFILECKAGNKHIHPLTGVFEVVDEELKSCLQGQLLVTSFTTHGTPLIRYKIGDGITLSTANSCDCGSTFPLVESIEGRTNDYLVSPEHGNVNLGNISNSTKGVEGIVCFQIVQRNLEEIDISIVSNDKFDGIQQSKFHTSLRARMGDSIRFNTKFVKMIATERSGKFRIVKNLMQV